MIFKDGVRGGGPSRMDPLADSIRVSVGLKRVCKVVDKLTIDG